MPVGTKIGLNLGFFKIDYELKMSEQEAVTRFLWDISSFRILQSRTILFTTDYVSEVDELKNKIHDLIKVLPIGSEIVNNLITLKLTCANFLESVNGIAIEIRSKCQATKLRLGTTQKPDDASIQMLNHYEGLGYLNLYAEPIPVATIYPENYKIDFLTNYGKFVGEFGTLIYFICSKSNVVITDALKAILPKNATTVEHT